MSLPIEEVDDEGRAVFFKSSADISKSVGFDSYGHCSHNRINDLFNGKRLPAPKFRGFVYHYSSYLILCSRTESGGQKVKQKVEVKAVMATYPCERNPNVVFMVFKNSKGGNQLRVLRFPDPIIGTKFRYVLDQLQLSPILGSVYLKNDYRNTTVNSGSSFSTPMREEESEASITSASHYFNRSAAHNPTMRAFYGKGREKEVKLPRVRSYVLNPMVGINPYASRYAESPIHQKLDVSTDFDSVDYEIYRPVSRKTRVDRCGYDYGESRHRSKRRSSGRRLDVGPSLNYNSREAVRNQSLVRLNPDYDDYRGNQYDYGLSPRSTSGRASKKGPLSNRYIYY